MVCQHRIWHPNIDPLTGRVMLPILGSDWRPVLSINTVLLGLQLIFLEPNPAQSINSSAAQQLQADPKHFAAQMQHILNGGLFFGYEFPRRSHVPVENKRRKRDNETESEVKRSKKNVFKRD